MNEREFKESLKRLDELSGNDLVDELAQYHDDPIIVSLLSGEEVDDIGIGRTTARKAAKAALDGFEDTEGTLTESLMEYEDQEADGYDLTELYLDLYMLYDKTGDDQKTFLQGMFEDYAYPSVVSYAVLTDWSLGFSDKTMADAFGVRDSLPFYDNIVNIVRADEPEAGPVIGQPFRPMLAVGEKRSDPDNPIAQRKIDGYRCLIHVRNERDTDTSSVWAFSRRLNDITESLPELQEIDWPWGSYVFDAEVVAETGSYSDTSERIGRKAENVERDVEMNFVLFDLVYADYIPNLHDAPYRTRHQILSLIHLAFANGYTRVLDLVRDIDYAKDEAIRRGDEGIIIKNENAPYEFGKRSAHWKKIKFDAETVDVRVTDVIEGDKKNTGTMGKLAIESADGVPIGHTGSGFSDAQRDEIWNNQDNWIGRTIEVEARGLDKNLRMPIFKRDRAVDGEPDSFDRIKEIMKEI